MIAQKDRCSIEMLLRDDDSYEFKPEMANITEIQEFINGLFDLIDEFNVKEKYPSIQQLTNYAVNSGADKRIRVHVDAENYRAKREQSLESLARKVAGKVTKYRRSVTLEPMNAYERHVIHAALQDEPGITTYSIGSEPNRRVVVSYDREKRQ